MDDATAARPCGTWQELCLFLDGSPSSFTGMLLIEKADPGNRRRLRQEFPRQVAAWEVWREIAPCAWGELEAATAIRMREQSRTVTYDLSDSARRHALIAALARYADRQQTLAAAGIDSDRNLTLAAHAKEMQRQAAEAAIR